MFYCNKTSAGLKFPFTKSLRNSKEYYTLKTWIEHNIFNIISFYKDGAFAKKMFVLSFDLFCWEIRMQLLFTYSLVLVDVLQVKYLGSRDVTVFSWNRFIKVLQSSSPRPSGTERDCHVSRKFINWICKWTRDLRVYISYMWFYSKFCLYIQEHLIKFAFYVCSFNYNQNELLMKMMDKCKGLNVIQK